MKRTLWMAFCVLMLMMSWEGQLTSANVVDNGPIPQESIRLRIIANSDSFQDQWLKREVRDALIAQMDTWATDIKDFKDAEKVVRANLPVMQQVVDQTIHDRGFSYKAVVDFGQVPFPTKLYGSYVYPAGDYEALRVQIGEAKGQNWWCVLFPPLCFIDMSNGDGVQAAPADTEQESVADETDAALETQASVAATAVDTATGRTRDEWKEWRQLRLEDVYGERQADREPERGQESQFVSASTDESVAGSVEAQTETEQQAVAPAPEIEVRFFLWDRLEKLFS
ncbi:stage II sporulation protein R [Brevibacillus centrosporus]|uniref:stage II sporulation protein R n=1 Tax=Brevibacillus centrosporus TaxID=54910 RepID=UPI002E2464DA|nr:stage II sporulation protein R [Brevibacillus centrosporus]MED4911402.1 stage II sporulation protein R [Brevibacillus centrosporus]